MIPAEIYQQHYRPFNQSSIDHDPCEGSSHQKISMFAGYFGMPERSRLLPVIKSLRYSLEHARLSTIPHIPK